VHPGEEGTGRKLFPSRISFDKVNNTMTWEPPVVRLIGNASFYERRRKGMSWPQWLVYKNIQKQMGPILCSMCSSEPASMPDPELGNNSTRRIYCEECFFEVEDDIKNNRTNQARIAWENKLKELKEDYRDKFFPVVYQVLQENKQTLAECGMVHRNVTAGKIVSLILQNNTSSSLDSLLQNENHNALAHEIYKMYERIFEQEKRKDALYPIVY